MGKQTYLKEIPGLDVFVDETWRLRRFKKLAGRALPLFLRGGDDITARPMALGHHEVDVETAVGWACEGGLTDFFIDIGANIGLTSCIAAGGFQRIFCFEPNPLAFKILEVNTAIALDAERVTLFREGLGVADEVLELFVPRQNWGGAFVLEKNRYDQATLAEKDGYGAFDGANYLRMPVEIREATGRLGGIFAELSAQGLRSGVVKIDAEGYEENIIEALSRSLPKDFRVWIVFENHDRKLAGKRFLELFPDRASLWKIRYSKMRGAKIVRLLKAIFGYRCKVELLPVTPGSNVTGNLVLMIGEK